MFFFVVFLVEDIVKKGLGFGDKYIFFGSYGIVGEIIVIIVYVRRVEI